MNRNEAIAYLTQCADDNGDHYSGGLRIYPDASACPTCKGTNNAGWLATPCSRYGRTSAEVAPVAYRHALIVAQLSGEPLTRESLSHSMSMAVNDHEDVQNDIRQYAAELAGANVDAMTRGYLECQLWAQHDLSRDDVGDGVMLDDNYSLDDIDSDYVESVRDELADVVVAYPLAVRMYLRARMTRYIDIDTKVMAVDANEGFGHDYYLTREHHGAGFWDRGLGELGHYLTDIAHYAGSADDLYDNGSGELTR
jgi:hypothetical protein